MSTFPANEFGGDPFPVRRPQSRRLTAEPDPKKGTAEEVDDLDDTRTYDLGGGD